MMRDREPRWALVAVAAALALAVLGAVLLFPGPTPTTSGSLGSSRSPGSTVTSPSPDEPTPTIDQPGGARRRIRLEHLTSGQLFKQGTTSEVATGAIRVPAEGFVIVHLMSCCRHAAVPSVSGAGLAFDLLVTHETGEKRHWVFGAVNPGPPIGGSLTFGFEFPQGVALWVVDVARNVDLRDPVVQAAWQDSMANAERGALPVAPVEHPANAMVGFALAGSGRAVDIRPGRGMSETGQSSIIGPPLLINTFWKIGYEGDAVEAMFLDAQGQSTIQSWLFLAIELRARSAGP